VINGVEVLILDLLEWLSRCDRSYEETMDAWRTSCPKLPVWEDANDRGVGLSRISGWRLLYSADARRGRTSKAIET
jgi:hypothetical protein